MDDESFGVACRYNVKSQLYGASFGSEDRSFFWEAFLFVLFLYNAKHPALLPSLKPSV